MSNPDTISLSAAINEIHDRISNTGINAQHANTRFWLVCLNCTDRSEYSVEEYLNDCFDLHLVAYDCTESPTNRGFAKKLLGQLKRELAEAPQCGPL
jgi:hypothetical protein